MFFFGCVWLFLGLFFFFWFGLRCDVWGLLVLVGFLFILVCLCF